MVEATKALQVQQQGDSLTISGEGLAEPITLSKLRFGRRSSSTHTVLTNLFFLSWTVLLSEQEQRIQLSYNPFTKQYSATLEDEPLSLSEEEMRVIMRSPYWWRW